MQYIGKLDKNKLGDYKNSVVTDDVVLTDERKVHIYEHHPKDYAIIVKNINRIILNPNEILEDTKNKDTIFLVDKLRKQQLKCCC